MTETRTPGKVTGTQLRYIKPDPHEPKSEVIDDRGKLPNGPADETSTDSALDAEIKRLATLSAANYERERRTAAKKLNIRVSRLDRVVAAERPNGPAPGSGRLLELASPEPWPSPVNGAALVNELAAAIRKYVVLSADAAISVALWVLHTHCFDAFACTPRLAITAPEKRCGKTTLLDVTKPLVPRALLTVNVTAAATFRAVEALRPVLLIDEGDTFLGENEELRGILNSGHRQGGQVIRTVGDDHEPRMFSTHCPVAIAQIGKLPDTLADRSVHVQLKRRAPSERVARLRIDRTPELCELASKAARWVTDNCEAIRKREPFIPDAIYNRAADNWEPLLAIAEVAGGDVPERARQAALGACGAEEELSRGAMLLADIREAFAGSGADRMTSADLTAALVAMADRPWCECNHGKSLTQNGLARRLKDFGIKPGNIGPKKERAKGYELAAFKDAFSRYLPESSFQTVHPYTTNEINDLEQQTVPHKSGCTVAKSPNQLNSNDVYGCTVQDPGRACAQNDTAATNESDVQRFEL